MARALAHKQRFFIQKSNCGTLVGSNVEDCGESISREGFLQTKTSMLLFQPGPDWLYQKTTPFHGMSKQ